MKRLILVNYHLILAIILNLTISLGMSIFYGSVSIFLYDLIGQVILLLISRKVETKGAILLLLFRVVSLIFLLMVYYGCIQEYGTPYYLGGSDDWHFENVARESLSNSIIWPWDYTFNSNCKGFYWLLMLLMKYFSYHTIAFRILNTDLLMCSAVFVYYIAYYSLGISRKNAYAGMTIMSLFPNSMYISSFVFRDTICLFIILLSYILIEDVFKNKHDKHILVSNKFVSVALIMALTWMAYWIRREMLWLLVFFVIFTLLHNKSELKKYYFLFFLTLILVIWIGYKLGAILYLTQKIERYSQYILRDILVNGKQSLSLNIFSEPLLPYGFLLRFLYGLVTPIPTKVLLIFHCFDSINMFVDVTIAIGVCFQIVCLPFFLKGICYIDRLTCSFFAIFITIIVTTFTFRHVLLFYPFMILIIVRGYDNCISRKKFLLGGLLLNFILFESYLLLKL